MPQLKKRYNQVLRYIKQKIEKIPRKEKRSKDARSKVWFLKLFFSSFTIIYTSDIILAVLNLIFPLTVVISIFLIILIAPILWMAYLWKYFKKIFENPNAERNFRAKFKNYAKRTIVLMIEGFIGINLALFKII